MAGGDEDHELKLLSMWASPFSTRAKLALALKGLSYENVEEDVDHKSDLLLRSNPAHRKVPVLIHGGAPVCESMVIVQYIDEAFPGAGPPIVTADPHQRATARFWAAYVEDEFLAPFARSNHAKTEEDRSDGRKQMLTAAEALERALARCSEGGTGFFGGDGVGLVDIALGSLLAWIKAAEVMSGDVIFDAVKTPLLAAWAERFRELDAAKATLPDVDRLVEFARTRLPAMLAATALAAGPNTNNQ